MKEVDGDYNQDLIVGLCEKQDSCRQCRGARIQDKGYQDYLDDKRYKAQVAYRALLQEVRESGDKERAEHYGVLLDFPTK